jgi:hypothetical protein
VAVPAWLDDRGGEVSHAESIYRAIVNASRLEDTPSRRVQSWSRLQGSRGDG